MCTGGGEKGLRERRLRLKFTGVHISPFDSYKCCKYHLPIILGSEFEVQSFKYRIYPLYASWSPYTAKGNVQFMNPISLSRPSPELFLKFSVCYNISTFFPYENSRPPYVKNNV